jgi:predicted nucleic acid-binding protein
MIVVDTNTIAYLYLPTEYTNDVEKLLDLDSDWVAPALWRSEFRNILALYIRKNLIDINTACQMQSEAELVFANNEYQVNSAAVLKLSAESGCSAYDCEFVSLAKTLNVKLITADKKVLNTFPETAVTASNYVAGLA